MKRSLALVDDPYEALRYPEYRNYVIASFLFSMALLIQEVALGYELYTITRDPLALGLTGLAQALPFISLSLFGGYVADRKNRLRIIRVSVGVIALGSCMLAFVGAAAASGSVPSKVLVAVIYGAVFLIGVCRAFQSPAASSLRAFLVPVTVYENATTWSSSTWQAASIAGPTLGGFLFAWLGFSRTLMAVAGLLILSWLLFARVKPRQLQPEVLPKQDLARSLKEGVRFVWQTKPILYAISLDLFSVLFGGVVALLPIFAQDLLNVGAEGLGLLRAAPSVGGILTLVILSRVSAMENAWRNLLIAVAGFGISILVFAVSRSMPLSLVALFFSGAFDSVSVVVRQTLLQIRTPDEMRGRVMAVNGIFVSSSNELGAFESGVAARVLGVVPSAIFGGVMTILIVLWVSWKTREFLGVNFRVPS